MTVPAVEALNVVIATAEPRGAYHLSPLADELARSPHHFTHLVPYPEPTQGDPVVPVVSTLDALDCADRVVVTGGTLSAWTELVANAARLRGMPTMYSELATVPATKCTRPAHFAAYSALSDSGARRVAAAFGVAVEDVTVTGTPALDGIPDYRPVPGRVLLLSTVDMVRRDPDLVLVRAAGELTDAGWHVRVRCHPREDLDPWQGFEVVSGETQAESAATSALVIGYPGSAHMLAAATGAPVVSVEPSAGFAAVLSFEGKAVLSATVVDVAGVVASVSALPTDPHLLRGVVGPIGGSAARLVAHFVADLSS